ncbi:hypothetical protein ACVIN2_002529 [Bradyrhizobium sp. USDA 3650]
MDQYFGLPFAHMLKSTSRSFGQPSLPVLAPKEWARRDVDLKNEPPRVFKKAGVDSGQRTGVPTDTAEKLKALERENRELRQANEILRKASAYFAMAELNRRSKP